MLGRDIKRNQISFNFSEQKMEQFKVIKAKNNLSD